MSACSDDLKTIPERVFCRLREDIVEGRIAAGSKISEADLAHTYGISRGPLREAIGQLASVGLVERRPNVGARVIALKGPDLLDIYHVREALEGMAARLAADHMTDEAVTELRHMLDDHGAQMREEGGNSYFQRSGDLDFHYKIVSGSGNARLEKLLCHDLYYIVRLYRYQFGMRSRRGPAALAEHTHIVDAIARRDGEMAELFMRAHIRASRENVERMLQSATQPLA
jgi:DNA-binding GntR family transcriptional regulator